MAQKEITGRHVFIGFVAAFSLIIGVNLVLAYSAIKTFPGLEVKNSYVASQKFDERKMAQVALGWTVKAELQGQKLVLSITDANGPVEVKELNAVLGRPTQVKDDREPDFVFDGTAYVAPMELDDGNWNIRMMAIAKDGTEFRQRVQMLVQR